jgi:hypothetical protein
VSDRFNVHCERQTHLIVLDGLIVEIRCRACSRKAGSDVFHRFRLPDWERLDDRTTLRIAS